MNPYQAYATANSHVDDDNRPRVLLKVYESMLEKIDVIKAAIRDKDFKRKYDELTKLTTAVEVLNSSLDFDRGGEIATNLSNLYQYVVRRLLTIHANNDAVVLDECRALLAEIHEGFKGAYKKENATSRSPEPSSTESGIGVSQRAFVG